MGSSANGHRSEAMALKALQPSPEEQWRHLRSYLDLNRDDLAAMAETVEILMRRGPEFVVATYDYLLNFKETAEILGWERGADPDHLAERRRFFTIWLARTIGLDLSDDLARYLFRAGKYHAGHGPRRIHVPELYVTGAVSLAQASFARYIAEEIKDARLVARALTGWNKLLTMHGHLMSAGYHAARDLESGDFAVPVSLFGRLRTLVGADEVVVHVDAGARAEHLLRKFFNYFPDTRQEVFDKAWVDDYRLDEQGVPWVRVEPIYRPRRDWNIRLNGRNLEYLGGLAVPVKPGDRLSIFPPGR
ncbi:MAG: protoglobin domain-containing protein [Caldilineales bacterium]|nr:protoglobin domain-containing protein [Caldilineales bacterium]MDW8317696.1 protoglobin domain-containing protein [Anaerolineae bacterium]